MLTARRFHDALALGLFLHIATLLMPGHDDVVTWKIWSFAAARDLTAMYGVGGTPPTRGLVAWGLVGPAFALALWQTGGLPAIARAGAAFLATVSLIVFPFYARGALPNMLLAFGSFDERRDVMSAYGANMGWIVNWRLRGREALPALGFPDAFLQRVANPLSITRFRERGYFDPRPISRIVVVAVTAGAAWIVRMATGFAIVAAFGAFTVHAFFVLSPNLHKSHQLLEVPLLAIAAALRPRFRTLLAAVSAIVTLNINLIYGAGLGMGWAVPRMMTGVDLTVLLAFVNAGVLAWFGYRLTCEAAEAGRSPRVSGQWTARYRRWRTVTRRAGKEKGRL